MHDTGALVGDLAKWEWSWRANFLADGGEGGKAPCSPREGGAPLRYVYKAVKVSVPKMCIFVPAGPKTFVPHSRFRPE